jgi:hypothetical protein
MIDIDDNKKLILHDEFSKLSPLIRSQITSVETVEMISGINEDAGIYSSERRRVVPVLIFRLVTKDIAPEQVIQALVSELQIKPEDAKHLAEEVVERIFAPIKQSLGELGIDVGKVIGGNAQAGVVSPARVVEMTAPAMQSTDPLAGPGKLNNLAAKYDSARPENDKLAPAMPAMDAATLAEIQQKRMAAPFDVGGQNSFFPQHSTGALPPRETKIDMNALPTLREEGDKVKFREAATPTSASSTAPFMLHEEPELMPVQTPQTFRSNADANYPRPVPAPTIPVRVEIGKSAEEKQVFGPSRFAPSFTPTLTPATPPVQAPTKSQASPSLRQAIGEASKWNEPATTFSRGEFATLAERNNRAERANESFRKPPSPSVPAPKVEPKVEGNTLDLRSQN